MVQEFGFTACLNNYLQADTDILLDSLPFLTDDILNSINKMLEKSKKEEEKNEKIDKKD